MAEPQVADYGTWDSPIAATELVAAAIGIDHVSAREGLLTWVETRPAEGGRLVIVAEGQEVTPAGFNVRTRVHEYGGLSYARLPGGALIFSNFGDQRVYLQGRDGPPEPITPAGCRYADFDPAPDGVTVACVREDHRQAGEARNAVVLLTPGEAGGAGQLLFGDSDFVAYPRLSPDGQWLAFIAWSHPSMPWDDTTLRVGRIIDGELREIAIVAGGADESVIEPRWSADGSLYFLSDRTDLWELYRWRDGHTERVSRLGADGGGALWALGTATYALTDDGRAVMRVAGRVDDHLVVLDLATGQGRTLDLPFATYHALAARPGGRAVAVAASTEAPDALIALDLDRGTWEVVRRPGTVDLPAGLLALGEEIEFPTQAAADGSAQTAHAYLYPPTNPAFRAPPDRRPPLLVQLHGGPTSRARRGFAISRQYWTSRGFAVVDVNYGGSTGYGRRYRNRLRGNWGLVDVADAVAAVDHLVATGRVDPARVAIRGASAGGFTTLAALAFTDRFRAGANYFGVADIEALARDTHKFESRYLDRLIAPLPAGRDVYRARSPLYHLERFTRPLITLQGAEDQVVPPAQSRAIVQALRARGIPVAYLEFEGEQHGFRRAATIVRAQEAELYFYGRAFGFVPAGKLEPVVIEPDLPAPAPPKG